MTDRTDGLVPKTHSEAWWALKDNVGRCTADSIRSGKRCLRPAIKGATVCIKHGGQFKHVRRAAQVRVVEAEATKALERLGVVPLDDSVKRMAVLGRVHAEAVAFYDELKTRAQQLMDSDDLTVVTTSQGEQLRAVLLAFERATDRVHRLLLDWEKAGMDARRIEIDEVQAKVTLDAVNRAFLAVLDHVDPPLSDTQKTDVRRKIGGRL